MAATPESRLLEQVEYGSGVNKLLLAAALGTCFVVAFLSHFPLEDRVQRLVKAQLAQIPGCRGDFARLQFELVLPKVLLSDVTLPASCFGKSGPPLTMRHAALRFGGPSFAPFGAAFTIEGDVNGQPLTIHYAAGVNSQVVNIQEESLNLAKLVGALPGMPKLEGRMKLNAKITVTGRVLEELKLLAESRDLVIPAQAVGDFRLPRLDLGSFAARVQSDGPNRVRVEEFLLGKPEAPVRMKFTGVVTPAAQAANTGLDLKGEAAFSPAFLEAFPILNLMLPQFAQKDGFHQIKLGGTLGAPKTSSL